MDICIVYRAMRGERGGGRKRANNSKSRKEKPPEKGQKTRDRKKRMLQR